MQRSKTFLCRFLTTLLGLCLVLSLCFFYSGNALPASAISNKETLSTDLLLPDYDTAANPYIFSQTALREVYRKLTKINDATYADVFSASETAKAGVTSGTIHKGLDSEDIRTRNGGKDLVIKLGGYTWIVTSLTRNSNEEPVLTLWLESESVYTAPYWNRVVSAQRGFGDTYPTDVYGASYIRARLLNGKGFDGSDNRVDVGYVDAVGATTLASYSADAAYPFGIFTETEAENSKSILDYLVQPKNIPYQHTESAYYTKLESTHVPNEALDYSASPWHAWGTIAVQNCPVYSDWGNDYLWLPSIAETGATIYGTTTNNGGYWNTIASTRSIGSGNTALRTGDNDEAPYVWYLTSAGGWHWAVENTISYALRPAIHLNLKKADEKSLTELASPQDATATYDGDPQSVAEESWYDSALFGAPSSGKSVEVSYYDEYNLNPVTSVKESGTYTVRFHIADPSHVAWADATSTTDLDRTCKLTVNKKSVRFSFALDPTSNAPVATPNAADVCTTDKAGDGSVPAGFFRLRYRNDSGTPDYNDTVYPKALGYYFASAEILNDNYAVDVTNTTSNNSYRFQVTARRISLPVFSNAGGDTQVYNGRARSFSLNYDTSEISVSVPAEFAGKINLVGDSLVTVTHAGDYALDLHLIDQTGAALWIDSANKGDRKLEFHVSRYGVSFDMIDASSTDDTIKVVYGNDKNVSIEMETVPLGADVINAEIFASMGGMTPIKIGTVTGIDSDSATLNCALLTNALPGGEWTLSVSTSADDYTVALSEPRTLVVEETTTDTMLNWRLYENNRYANKFLRVDVTDTGVVFAEKIVFNGKTYGFQINRAPSGYMIDTAYASDGFVNGYRVLDRTTNTPVTSVCDAGEYKTQVRLLDAGNNPVLCEIDWNIDRAVFDLSSVKWQGDGQIEYRDGNIEIKLENLPAGLEAHYSGAYQGMGVGPKGTVSVTFSVSDPDVAKNYTVPDRTDPDSYQGTSFEWEKDWEVVKAVVKVQWVQADRTDAAGKTYRVWTLADDLGAVDYEYYVTDQSGNLDASVPPVDESEILVSDTDVVYYKVLPKLKSGFAVNYEIENAADPYSPHFAVGKQRTPVQVSLASDRLEYKGKSQPVKLVITGGVPESAFVLTYLDSNGVLAQAPAEVGSYRVQVSLNGTYLDSYELTGDYEFTYQIVPSEIPLDWNANAKPCVLRLKYGQINGISYEILNENDEPVTDVNALVIGKSYKIRAVVKPDQIGNYVFEDGSTETAWQTFTVNAGDVVRDPNDPTNPNYPQTDPDAGEGPVDPPPVDPEKPEENINIPLWQLCVSILSLILGVAFFAKATSYRSKAKEAKKRTEKVRKQSIDPTEFAAVGFALGVDETFLSLTATVWSGIACGLAALCALSLAFLIVSRKKFVKASEALEAAEQEAFVAKKRKEVSDRMREEQREEEYRKREEQREEERRRREEEREEERRKREEELRREDERREEERRRKRQEEREEDRRLREEEREEEQQRRNEEMKMMFMMMNKGGGKSAQTFEGSVSVDEIVTRVVAQLLPSLQNALPAAVVHPASDNDAAIEALRNSVEELKDLVSAALVPPETVYEEHVTETVTETVEEPEPQVYEEVVEEVIEEQPQYEEVQVAEEQPQVEEILQVATESPKEKIPAEPKLTLDDAYARLSKEQKKFFDGLRAYAMSKDKCKEKKSTYFVLFGQSSANPLVKLCIKKDTTVARFKLEDEYTKSLRRNAGSEGTKIKVKETEVSISDAQAFATAKEMIDLREDQIERYEEFLKEQRQLSKLK